MGGMWRAGVLVVLLALLGGCAGFGKFRNYAGPEVTRIVIEKSERRMHLLHGEKVLRSYDIALGREPVGQKRREGDGRTPEGNYIIDRRNPRSAFHLSLGISYPTVSQRRVAREAGLSPGGDIFIHGQAGKHRGRGTDWTEGCIAVTDREIEEIYAMVRVGTPITIRP
jgi:murein L,D-transpeptidase YafK